MALLDELCSDLTAETAELLGLLRPLDELSWSIPTPAEGWSIKDAVTHLAAFDDRQRLAVLEPATFRLEADAALQRGDLVEEARREAASLTAPQVLEWFERARSQMIDALGSCDPSSRIEWYGPPMSPASALTARLMETWAHGQDIRDALGLEPAASPRLRHIALLGLRARGFAYAVRGLQAPATRLAAELTGPDGDRWWLGDEDAEGVVRGDALEFCLLVTQRRHRLDTSLVAVGPGAEEFLDLAQAFAGPAGPGRSPRGAGER
jgi:uncharacterized protein (TIGR03084 family)